MTLFWGIFIQAMFVLNSDFSKILHYWEMDAIYEGFIITFLHVFT